MDKEEMYIFQEKNRSLKKKSIFENWKNEIFFMKSIGATLTGTLDYLFSKDKELKSNYKNRKATLVTILSKFIKKNEGYKFEDSATEDVKTESEKVKVEIVEKDKILKEDKKEPINKSALIPLISKGDHCTVELNKLFL